MNKTNIIFVISAKNYLGLNTQIQKFFFDQFSPEGDYRENLYRKPLRRGTGKNGLGTRIS
jgi:hypothetical protein